MNFGLAYSHGEKVSKFLQRVLGSWDTRGSYGGSYGGGLTRGSHGGGREIGKNDKKFFADDTPI